VLRELEEAVRSSYERIFAMPVRLRLVLAIWLVALLILMYFRPGPEFLNVTLYRGGNLGFAIVSTLAGALAGSVVFVRR
jgi:hypothetical protein